MTIAIMKFGRWSLGCALLLLTLLLTGCQSGDSGPAFAEVQGVQPAITGSTSVTNPAVPAAQQPAAGFDILRPGDALTITFNDLPVPVMPIEDRIKEDGSITLLQNQRFIASGKTRGELEKEIRDRYVPRFYVTMTVNVRPQRDTQFYYVGGEVKTPGRFVYTGVLTVTKAIQSAGDFTDFANRRNVKLYRVNGKVETINCKKALVDPNLDPTVLPGDKIHVFRSIW